MNWMNRLFVIGAVMFVPVCYLSWVCICVGISRFAHNIERIADALEKDAEELDE